MLYFTILTIICFAFPRADCTCPSGPYGIHRFGPICGFMCHCKNNEQCEDTTGECASGCASFWFGPGCQYRDIAEGEFSRQSDNVNPPQYSYLANDGNPETCSYTAEANSVAKRTNPFLRIWLRSTETISELMILTKIEKLDHFKGFQVYVENVTEDQRENSMFIPPDRQICYKHADDAPKNETIKVLCEIPVVGNQIRIELEAIRPQLVLCDVKINGGRNLAFSRYISQTKAQTNRPAHQAVDGHEKQSSWTECSFVGNVDNPFLRLDIGKNALIWYIRILPFKNIHTMIDNIDQVLRLRLEGEKTSLIEKTVGINEQIHSVNISLNTTVVRYVTITKPGKSKRLQICELNVFGDCLEDECDFDCSKTCHCKNTNIWDKMSGICSSGCKEGWIGESCDQLNGTEYQQSCGHCLDSNECDTSTGKCRTGCQAGYYPSDCNIECQSGRYGRSCLYTCPSSCNEGVCDSVDGKCKSGCKPGYFGENCENTCRKGFYGIECVKQCGSHCVGGIEKCSNVNGACSDGCVAGWRGKRCKKRCQKGSYGQKCNHTCSMNCNYGLCHNVHGVCLRGCKPGYIGSNCDQNCHAGQYGKFCMRTCSVNCNDGLCHNVDGICLAGCRPGYFGEKCDQRCQNGKYGKNCNYVCSENCNDGLCHNFDGICLRGCKPGYFGTNCDQELSE